MDKILWKDIDYIESITKNARKSFKMFERFTIFLESEVTRIQAKDIKSIADDIKALEKLFIEAKTFYQDLEIYQEHGDLLEIFKTGEKVKNALEKIKSLEYLTYITPNTFY